MKSRYPLDYAHLDITLGNHRIILLSTLHALMRVYTLLKPRDCWMCVAYAATMNSSFDIQPEYRELILIVRRFSKPGDLEETTKNVRRWSSKGRLELWVNRRADFLVHKFANLLPELSGVRFHLKNRVTIESLEFQRLATHVEWISCS